MQVDDFYIFPKAEATINTFCHKTTRYMHAVSIIRAFGGKLSPDEHDCQWDSKLKPCKGQENVIIRPNYGFSASNMKIWRVNF